MRLWKKTLKMVFLYAILPVASFVYAAEEIQNPIKARTFLELVKAIASAVTAIAKPLAILAITIAGLRFVMASVRGDSKALGEAKTLLFWTLIGTAVVVGAAVLAQVAVNVAQNL